MPSVYCLYVRRETTQPSQRDDLISLSQTSALENDAQRALRGQQLGGLECRVCHPLTSSLPPIPSQLVYITSVWCITGLCLSRSHHVIWEMCRENVCQRYKGAGMWDCRILVSGLLSCKVSLSVTLLPCLNQTLHNAVII